MRFFGEVQMEIVREVLRSRFDLQADFFEPRVIYKETPLMTAQAYIDHRTHGYAIIHVRIDPLPLGSGFHFASEVKAEKIYHKFMKQIPQILQEARRTGPLGWEVTDFRLTVLDGHSKYDLGTQPGDFKLITPLALAAALQESGTRLLEPMMDFEIRVPELYAPQIYRELVRMRAQFEDPTPLQGMTTFRGVVPFAETFKYTAVLYAAAHGQAVLKTRFVGYAPAESEGTRSGPSRHPS
jgi:ribosomal protection tetracycline resistance protein